MPFEVQILSIIFGSIAFIVYAGTKFTIKKKELELRELELRGSDPKLRPELDALRDDLDDTREQLADMQEHTQAQLADMQERLDFAERLLTAGRASLDEKSK